MTVFVAPSSISRTDIPPLFDHQEQSVQFKIANPRVMDLSDPGTGKSRTVLEACARLKAEGKVDHLLVLAPLSILEPSWAKDCRKFTPQLDCQVVTAKTKFK